MGQLDPRHVERHGRQFDRGVAHPFGPDIMDLGAAVDEPPDEPGAGDAVDLGPRAVFVDFVVYSPNVDFLSQVKRAFEFRPTGRTLIFPLLRTIC